MTRAGGNIQVESRRDRWRMRAHLAQARFPQANAKPTRDNSWFCNWPTVSPGPAGLWKPDLADRLVTISDRVSTALVRSVTRQGGFQSKMPAYCPPQSLLCGDQGADGNRRLAHQVPKLPNPVHQDAANSLDQQGRAQPTHTSRRRSENLTNGSDLRAQPRRRLVGYRRTDRKLK